MRPSQLRFSVALSALLVLTAACSGGDGAATTTAPTTTAAADPTTTITSEAPGSSATSGPSGPTTTLPVDYQGPAPILWVTHVDEGTVSRIDVANGEVLDTIDVGGEPQEILYAEGAVWVTDTMGEVVHRIDPASLQVTTLDAGPLPFKMTAIPGLIFITNVAEEGSVTVLRTADGARVALLPVGPYPTATAVAPGPPTSRAYQDLTQWNLWIGHSEAAIMWTLLGRQPLPPSQISWQFYDPAWSPPSDPSDIDEPPPATTTTTFASLEEQAVHASYNLAAADAERRGHAAGMVAARSFFEQRAAEARADLERIRRAAAQGDLTGARHHLSELEDQFNREDDRTPSSIHDAFAEQNTLYEAAVLSLRSALGATAGDPDSWEAQRVRELAERNKDLASFAPHFPPPAQDPAEVNRNEHADYLFARDAFLRYDASVRAAREAVLAAEQGQQVPDPAPEPTRAAVGWPGGEAPLSSVDPGTGMDDLVLWNDRLFGFAWETGKLVAIEPASAEVKQRYPGPAGLSDGFTASDYLWGVAPGEGLWRFDGTDFAEHRAIPGLSAAAGWWDAIYAATDTGEILTVGYDGSSRPLIAGLPAIWGIAVQPPDGLTPQQPTTCPGVPLGASAIAPAGIPGYGEACPDGTLKAVLGLQRPEDAWDPLGNPIVWTCAC
ncbi:MAG: hypothetical protein JW785_04625, partial [Acidimicrobiia bacterium]|nr:hypothetical protein [Acidimicrobiia bacterium]